MEKLVAVCILRESADDESSRITHVGAIDVERPNALEALRDVDELGSKIDAKTLTLSVRYGAGPDYLYNPVLAHLEGDHWVLETKPDGRLEGNLARLPLCPGLS